MTASEVGRLFDSPASSILQRMRRDGIPRRSKSEGQKLSFRHGRKTRPVAATRLRPILGCRGCGWTWKRLTEHINEPCPMCGRMKSARKRDARHVSDVLKWGESNRPDPNRKTTLRYRVLMLVGGGEIRCVRCGCDRRELLEINHKNGGGRKEIKSHGASVFYSSIIKLERTTEDLELCCRVCNAWHALELKYGTLPYRVTYGE